ncbi:hypothetical protein PVAND_013888 [Polypedilum vanderplanki]|uniref:cyclin-dependent kinase n=1 Tax=Polypedilum vanderplanki TaxID=319348 RepID=A0A9J6CS37_POLVA|nr:hypothetical protein PVAND_013888 [Polypedilum vanderplanki]
MSTSMDHSDDDEGQIRSSDNLMISDDDATNDSLDIKPPQSKSYKDKQKKHKRHHEKKHKEKERHRDYSRDKGEDRRYSPENRREYREKDYDRGAAMEKLRKPEQSRSRRTSTEESMKYEYDRREEDLRNRLIRRRQQEDPTGTSSRKEEIYERKEKREYKREYVDEFDDYENSKKYKSHKSIDPEAEARKKKFLDADRDDKRRKERARQELEARREQHRSKEIRSREVSLSPERKKSRYNSEERKARREIVTVSSERSDEEMDSESDSHSSKSDEKEEESDFEMSPEERIPLEKSPRRDATSHSASSRSQSRSREDSRSISRSKSRSRSHTRSESSSISDSHSDDESSKSSSSESEEEKKKSDDDEEKDKNKKEKSPKPQLDESKEEASLIEEEDELPPYFPALQGCRSVEEFQCLNRIEEGTYGVVYRAKDKRTDEIVALKRLKMEKEKEGFPITSLREINTLLKGQHPNIVTVREIVVGSNMDKIFIVMDYVEHDLKSLIETMKHKKQVFLPGEVKCLTQQLLRAVAHLHDNWILHRDLKTSNLLLSHKGILKVGDFGLAREYGSPLKEYTSVVVTLWYRAPELLLGCKEYSTPIDVWSCGCIFAELLAMTPLFPGKSEVDQLNRIFKDLGTPNEKVWAGYDQLPLVKKMSFTDYPVSQIRKKFATNTSPLGLSLLQGLLTYDPKQRLTADAGLNHEYFKEMPLPIDPSMFPTWPAKSEVGWKRAMVTSPKPPSGGTQFKKLGAEDENTGFTLSGTYTSYSESRKLAMGSGFSLKF